MARSPSFPVYGSRIAPLGDQPLPKLPEKSASAVALATLGATLGNIGDQLRVARNESQALSAETRYLKGRDEIDQRYERDPDYATVPARKAADLEALKSDTLGGVSDPEARDRLDARLTRQNISDVAGARRASLVRENDAFKANLDETDQADLRRALAAGVSPAERASIEADRTARIDAGVRTGHISAQEGQSKKEAWRRSLDISLADKDVETDPEGTLRRMSVDPNAYPGLRIEDRDRLRDRAQSGFDQRWVDDRREAVQRHGASAASMAAAIRRKAAEIGADPVDYATVISFETGGSFSTSIRGGAGNRHIGLIQAGDSEQREFGFHQGQTFEEQLDSANRFLKARGFKPGMGRLDLYSTINAGRPGLYDRSDTLVGGTAGTVRDKVERQMAAHERKARALLGTDARGGGDPSTWIAIGDGNAVGFGGGGVRAAAQEGADPDTILRWIEEAPKTGYQGRSVLLSGGATARADRVSVIGDQARAIMAAGAREVAVLGVGPGEGGALEKARVNDRIREAIKGIPGARFVELGETGADGRPKDFAALRDSVIGRPAAAAAPAGGAAVNPGVGTAGLPAPSYRAVRAGDAAVAEELAAQERARQALIDNVIKGNEPVRDNIVDNLKLGHPVSPDDEAAVRLPLNEKAARGDASAIKSLREMDDARFVGGIVNKAMGLSPAQLEAEVAAERLRQRGRPFSAREKLLLQTMESTLAQVKGWAASDPIQLGIRQGLVPTASPILPGPEGRDLSGLGPLLRQRSDDADRVQSVNGSSYGFWRPEEKSAWEAAYKGWGADRKAEWINTLSAHLPERAYRAAVQAVGGNDRLLQTAGVLGRRDPGLVADLLRGGELLDDPGAKNKPAEILSALQARMPSNVYPPEVTGDLLKAAQALYAAERQRAGTMFDASDGAALEKAIERVAGTMVKIGGRMTPAPTAAAARSLADAWGSLDRPTLDAAGGAVSADGSAFEPGFLSRNAVLRPLTAGGGSYAVVLPGSQGRDAPVLTRDGRPLTLTLDALTGAAATRARVGAAGPAGTGERLQGPSVASENRRSLERARENRYRAEPVDMPILGGAP